MSVPDRNSPAAAAGRAVLRGVDTEEQEVMLIKTRVDAFQIGERTYEQPRANQQHHGQPNLNNHQRFAKSQTRRPAIALHRSPGFPSGFFERRR